MGPIALFDKSFLQSLSEDESVWFDHFFFANVCPIFYVETQADLAKEDPRGLTPEQLVERIAKKFPEYWGAPNAYHPNICTANLLGDVVPMNGQIILSPGGRGFIDGHLVIAHLESREAKAFLRWTQRQFEDEEREAGKMWRTSGFGTDPAVVIDHLREIGAYENARCPTLTHVLAATDEVLDRLTAEQQLALALQLFGTPDDSGRKVIDRFRAEGEPSLEAFANYTSYALKLELFYHIAVHKGRMGTAQRMDINYLFYLPFCNIFVSTDWVHRDCTPLFLREDQEFVSGPQLKAALKELNGIYSAIPDAESKSIVELAPQPPQEGDNLVSQLWDRRWPKWRQPKENGNERASEEIKWVQEHSKEIGEILQQDTDHSASGTEFRAMVRTKTVRTRRGRWWTVPENCRRKPRDEKH